MRTCSGSAAPAPNGAALADLEVVVTVPSGPSVTTWVIPISCSPGEHGQLLVARHLAAQGVDPVEAEVAQGASRVEDGPGSGSGIAP